MILVKRYGFFIVFAFCIAIFSYFRLKPIELQTVAYTYDQGRDFLKAAEIILQRKPTFIGPTTGVNGLFHGAWWYYFLAIPFFLLGSNPINFYLFHFIIHLITFIIVVYFIRTYFSSITAIVIAFLIATSPYLLYTDIFLGNNTETILPFVLFLISLYFLASRKKPEQKKIWVFIASFVAALAGEFELAFGLFLIPSFLIITLIFPVLRKTMYTKRNILPFIAGFAIALLPRVLFEVKNHFLQTKTLISQFTNPHLYTPRAFPDVLREHWKLITQEYFKGIFSSTALMFIAIGTVIITTIFLFRLISQKKKGIQSEQTPLFIYCTLFFLLFTLSLTYKDTFWRNYYDAFPYVYIFIFIPLLTPFFLFLSKRLPIMLGTGLILFFIITLIPLRTEFVGNQDIKGGLQLQKKIVNYITQAQNINSYCVKVYTPPVIPYTYQYLFLDNHLSQKKELPQDDWIQNKCWIIVESDDYEFRQQKWLSDNVPIDSITIDQKQFETTAVFLKQKINEK